MPLLHSREIVLDANGRGQDIDAGHVLLLDSLSIGSSVNVIWIDKSGNDAGRVEGVLIGRLLDAGGEFGGYRLEGQAGAVVKLMVGASGAYSQSLLTSSLVIGHVIVDAPMPSTPVTGPLTDVQLRAAPVPVSGTMTPALGAALSNVAPVACSAVIAAALAVSAARRAFYARNLGPNNVALVAAAGSYANAAIVLQPGETWREDLAPGAAWYAICQAAETATLNILAAA